MLGSLLRFEVKYHLNQLTFQATAMLFFNLGVIMPLGGFGGADVAKNGPYVINFIICLLSIFIIFVSALFCSNVVLRDKSYQTEGLIFSTGVSKRVYVSAKLAGLLLAVFLIMCLAVLGIFAGSVLLSANQKGEFRLLYYLQPLFLFGLPNALFCSSILFAAAMWTQQVKAVYVTGVFLFILYFTASILGNSPLLASSALKSGGLDWLAVLADPFGLTTFFGETRNWPVWRRNHDLYPLKGAFLGNRLLWTGSALGLITLSYSRFRFGLNAEKQVRKAKNVTEIRKAAMYRPLATQLVGPGYFFSSLRSQLRLEVAFLFKQHYVLILLALWVFLYSVELTENLFHGQYTIRFFPTTALVIEQLLSVRLALLLLIYYASELIHREHVSRMQALVFSTPISNTILVVAKTGALALLIAVLIGANILTGLGLQLVTGYRDIAFLPYLSLFYYSGLQLLLFAVFIVFIQVIIPNKYLGMLLSLVIVGVSIFGKLLGIDGYLLRFGSAPTLVYSTMASFGHYTQAFNGYMLFWALLACLLGVLTARWWPTGTHDTGWIRMKAGLTAWPLASKIAVVAGLLILISTGLYIGRQSNGITLGGTRQKDIQWQKRYELAYKSASKSPQPVVTAVNIHTDLYPDEQRYGVSGRYTLKNESRMAISTLWIGVDPAVTVVNLQMSGACQQRVDNEFNQYVYTLTKPLLPGAEMTVAFSLQTDRSSYRPFDREHSMVSNGSYIELEKFLPFFGYNDRFELDDPQTRQENGLAAQIIPAETDHRYQLVHFENTISTHADQQVVTVGNLQKAWKKGNRSYFHYKTVQPIAFMFALSSARYAVRTETYQGILYRIYYHPGQTQNVPILMQALKDVVQYGRTQFSPYPLNQLILAEIPAYRGSATAYPGVIFSHEKFNFLVDTRDTSRFNFIYATTAHETAHQWWANQIRPQTGSGYAFLTESLAKYTEAMVCEKKWEKMRLRQYLQTDNNLYFALRNLLGQQELPLDKTWNQPFAYYQKGGLALYAIREMLGENRVNKALKRLIANHAYPQQKPSPDDFIYELTGDATPFEEHVIEDQLKKVIVYDNRIRLLSSRAIGQGRFKLQLLVWIQKTDETNIKPKPLPPNDWLDIAIFGSEESTWNPHTKPIYCQKYHLVKPQTVIDVVVDQVPKVIALDPYGYLLDADLKNNLATF